LSGENPNYGQAVMRPTEGSYDPDTLRLLRAVLDEAWGALTPEQQSGTFKSEMALRVLRLAQQGERDPVRLRMAAMLGVPFDIREKRPPTSSIRRGSEGAKSAKSTTYIASPRGVAGVRPSPFRE
jgi:hypothetical protein